MKTEEGEFREFRKFLNLPAVTQIGIVVPNIDETIAFYKEKFLLEPVKRIENSQTLGYKTFYKGEQEEFASTLAFFRMGTMELEILQPLYGRSIYKDFLDAGRQGLHHLGFDVSNDYDQRLAAYEKMGIGVLMSGRGPDRGFAYLDTEKLGGFIFELLNRGGPRIGTVPGAVS